MIKNANRINQLPTYVPGKPIEELKRELGIESPIKLASNENPLGPSPLALKKMQSMIKNVALYPDGDSYSLKRKICMIENVLPNQIIIGNGSNEVLELIAHSYLNKDDEAIMGEYCFIVYPIVTTLSEGKIIRSKMPDLTHSVDNILALITENHSVTDQTEGSKFRYNDNERTREVFPSLFYAAERLTVVAAQWTVALLQRVL